MPNPIGALTSILGAPFTTVMDSAAGIIGKFIVDPSAKLQAQKELLELEQSFRAKLLDADTALAQQQAQVIIAEAKSESWLARNWRPILMLTFTFIIAWNFIISPLTGAGHAEIPPDMWQLLKLGITGYIVGRSTEKIAPAVANAINKKDDA